MAPSWLCAGPPEKRARFLPQMMADLSRRSADILDNAREHLYVNCWCLDLSESMAMWQIYGSLGFGVALKSSVEQYKRAARFEVDQSHYIFGDATYHENIESAAEVQRDFTRKIPLEGSSLRREVLKLGLHKRSCYRYEHEWRAVMYQNKRPEIAGLSEAFDLGELISAVYVGPRAQDFHFEAVSATMDKFLLRTPLERSVLLGPPRRETAPAV